MRLPMFRLSFVSCAMLLVCPAVRSHDIITTSLTFEHDIAPIFAQHCAKCHGEKSSIPLMSYEDARPWAVSIKEQVLSRAMPPWGAVRGFGRFEGDNSLTGDDIQIIAGWVLGGAPQGTKVAVASAAARTYAGRAFESKTVDTRVMLDRPATIAGLQPVVTDRLASAKITAEFPDGKEVPIVWLFNYDPKFGHAFLLKAPIEAPAGTVIKSNVPLRYELKLN